MATASGYPAMNDHQYLTQFSEKSSSLKWIISGFSKCKAKPKHVLESHKFFNREDGKTKFYLKLCPVGDNEDNKDFVVITLMRESRTICTWVDCTVSVVDSDGKEALTNTFSDRMLSSYRFPNFIERVSLFENKNKLLPNDVLTITCAVTVSYNSTDTLTSGQPTSHYKENATTSSLSRDLEKFYESNNLSDVVLKVGKREFYAHRDILAARSTVFSAMFQHEMREKKTGTVEISGIECEVIDPMLRYIYSDKMPNLSLNLAKGLLQAAEQYELLDLKLRCMKYLKASIAMDNVFDVLMFKVHDDFELRHACIDFICENLTLFTESSDLNKKLTLHPEILTEVLKNVAKKASENKKASKATKDSDDDDEGKQEQREKACDASEDEAKEDTSNDDELRKNFIQYMVLKKVKAMLSGSKSDSDSDSSS